jgi:adenine deaminase
VDISQLLSVARGDTPADLLLQNGRMINVFSGGIEEANIAVAGKVIAGVGHNYTAAKTVDLDGSYVAPGLIDAHVHIESSLCTPPHFASVVVPRGVTTVVTDPHEIANVAGIQGVRTMADMSRGLPLHVEIMAPSCVPATGMETNGARLDAADLAPLLADDTAIGLAEVMNFPGVFNGAHDMLAKLNAFQRRPIDGHAPALAGRQLNAYVAAGIGSEHECTTVEEAAEKLARGLYVFIREATNARNLHPLLPLITPENSRRICFCTDDRIAGDLLTQGSIDYMIREAIAYGIEPITAFRLATLNAAEWFGLHNRGAIGPGRLADLMIFDDLAAPSARQVYVNGRLVAENGRMIAAPSIRSQPIPPSVASSVKIDWQAVDLAIQAAGKTIRVIGTLPDQLLTEERVIAASVESGLAVADPNRDVLKMAVIDRHSGKSGLGLGFIQGMGLRSGAIAGTTAHDHHNLVIIGADDANMRLAGQAVTDMGGGLVVVNDGSVVASLALPIAGLMSDRPAAEVSDAYQRLLDAATGLGSRLHDPFMAMSFMALEVIPKLKLTDKGLIDVEQFQIVDLFV